MHSSNPKLSILIPAHNVALYLPACLSSIFSQLPAEAELLLLNDASTDDTDHIVAQYQQKYSDQMRVLSYPKPIGVAAARNALIDAANGDYLWFIDADDLLTPDAIAEFMAIIGQHDVDLVLCDFSVLRTKTKLSHRLRGKQSEKTFVGAQKVISTDKSMLAAGLLRSKNLQVWSKIGRRGLWKKIRFPEGRVFEDVAIMPVLIQATSTYYYHPKRWIIYRLRSDSIVHAISATKLDDMLFALRHLYQGLTDRNLLANADVREAFQLFCLQWMVSTAKRLAAGAYGVVPELLASFEQTILALFGTEPVAATKVYLKKMWPLRWWRARKAFSSLKKLPWRQPETIDQLT